MTYTGNNQVSIAPNTYDFDRSDHPWFGGNFWRNIFTLMGSAHAGEGVPFLINFSGLSNLTYDKYHSQNIMPQL